MRMAMMLTVVLLMGLGGMADMAIEASKPYPDPDATVTFTVEGAPEGSEFRWTLGEHDTVVGAERWLRWEVPEGFHVVEVEALQDEQVVAAASYGVLADSRLGATRTVEKNSKRVEVRITVRVKATVTGGLNIEETVPQGWAVGERVTDGDLEP
ncbi:MAG: hypothetical protein R6U88_05300, partial [Candidatus Bipolaricaulota bacterium]